jgi:hypothetical protein
LKKLTHRKQAGDANEDNPEIDAALDDFDELGDDDDNVDDPETGHKSFEGKGSHSLTHSLTYSLTHLLIHRIIQAIS